MTQHGGKRPGAGRKPGGTNKATQAEKRTLSELAKELAPDALAALARIMRDEKQSGAAIVAAANSILDRAYGRPFAADPEHDDDAAPVSWSINVRAAKGQVRVTQSKRTASDIPEGA